MGACQCADGSREISNAYLHAKYLRIAVEKDRRDDLHLLEVVLD